MKKTPDDGQLSFDDILNPDYADPKEEKAKRRRKTKEIMEEIEEKITDVEYSDVMKKSYIDYSMSVITARALPDVRDGLKPVQRRILYDMQVLGTTSDKPYRKSARIVGDAMGKFHPHGDSSIYGALVNMAQDFRNNAPLVDGHGNFGSIEGDGAAAMRYTEARMTGFTEDVFLSGLREDTVDFMPNYDESEKEPAVLPCRLPSILINGSEGIAVGMATNIPMHNTGEVIDAALAYLDDENITVEGLMEYIKGPDFPTGGIVANRDELPEIYRTGAGKIRLRGRVSVEHEGGRDRIVISEIPYTMVGDGIGKFLLQTAALVENKTLPEITDISNQSSKEGIRIVIDLKKGADAERITNILYKKTKLEDTFGATFLMISHGRPETMSLTDVFRDFTAFQYEINTRKYQNLLKKAEKKREIDEGLIRAIDVLDTIIEVIRGSKTVKVARDCLMTGNTEQVRCSEKAAKQAAKFNFTEAQADAILELRLQRLVGLEIDVLQEDYQKTLKNISHYEKVLKSRAEMRKVIAKDLMELRIRYSRPRRTQIMQTGTVEIEEAPEEILPVTVTVDRFYYVRALDKALYEKNKETVDAEARYVFDTMTDRRLIVFTEGGKAHTLRVKDVPLCRLKDKGVPLDNVCGYSSKTEAVVQILPLADTEWIFLSSDGYIKRVNAQEFDVTRRTIDSTRLSAGAKVVSVTEFSGDTLQVTSAKGYRLRFKQEDIPLQGKTARGAIAMKLDDGDAIIESTTESRMHITRRGGKGKKG